MAKSFLTFQAQISFLEQDKNLLVENHTFAEAMLTQIGYFSLIGGYKTPFKTLPRKSIRMVLGLKILLLCTILTRICVSCF